MIMAEMVPFIKLAIPADRRSANSANDDAIATAALKKAIMKVGKIDGVYWNLLDVQFNLAANKADNVQGVDFLKLYPELQNIQLMYHTDTTGGEIEIVGLERFKSFQSGSVGTGRPVIATFNGQGKLSVYPTPDQAYTVTARVKKPIDNLADIPSNYHDMILDEAVLAIQAMLSSGVAIRNAVESRAQVQAESPTGYTGSQILADRVLGADPNTARATSHNLTGN